MWGHGTLGASRWTTWKRFHKSHTYVCLELIVYKGFFKYLLLNCTMNREVCKRNCLIGAFIQHLTHFLLGFLRLLLDVGVQNPAIFVMSKDFLDWKWRDFVTWFSLCCNTIIGPSCQHFGNAVDMKVWNHTAM